MLFWAAHPRVFPERGAHTTVWADPFRINWVNSVQIYFMLAAAIAFNSHLLVVGARDNRFFASGRDQSFHCNMCDRRFQRWHYHLGSMKPRFTLCYDIIGKPIQQVSIMQRDISFHDWKSKQQKKPNASVISWKRKTYKPV